MNFKKTLVSLAVIAAFASPALSQTKGEGDNKDMGATGWHGAQKTQSDKPFVRNDEHLAATQTPTASGLDLKGPAMQFAPSKTPE